MNNQKLLCVSLMNLAVISYNLDLYMLIDVRQGIVSTSVILGEPWMSVAVRRVSVMMRMTSALLTCA